MTVSRKKIDVIDLGSAVAPIQISDVEALEQVSAPDFCAGGAEVGYPWWRIWPRGL